MIVIAPPLLSYALGFWARRWSVAALCALVAVAVSLSGWMFGWAGDSDTPALGGATIFAMIVGMPFVGGACLGVRVGRSGLTWWGRESDVLVEVRLDVPPEQRGRP